VEVLEARECWISARDAAKILRLDHAAMKRVAAIPENTIRVLAIPGCYVRYHAEDVRRLAARSVKLAARQVAVALPGEERGSVTIQTVAAEAVAG
jgi:hypothetical protein